jgi:hypothetical protein
MEGSFGVLQSCMIPCRNNFQSKGNLPQTCAKDEREVSTRDKSPGNTTAGSAVGTTWRLAAGRRIGDIAQTDDSANIGYLFGFRFCASSDG